MEKNDVIKYVMNSPQNTNPAILGQMLDEMGGSGSSDFTIAQMTLSFNSNSYVQYPSIAGVGDYDRCMAMSVEDSGTYPLVLYKGQSMVTVHDYSSYEVTEDATDLGGGYILATGDCTITIS